MASCFPVLKAIDAPEDLGQEVSVEWKDYEQFMMAMKVMWFHPENNE
jgi:hypothetical protein